MYRVNNKSTEDLLLENYNYMLPNNRIAQRPSQPAHNAKMMICEVDADGKLATQDTHFFNLPEHLDKDTILFLNRTKVFKARIPLKDTKIVRRSGKEILLKEGEIFIYAITNEQECECLVSDSKNFKPGAKIFFDTGVVMHSLRFTENGILFRMEGDTLLHFLEQRGKMPLPPYIHYEKEKEQRYQTFFAQEIGSAAAPTASLHFTPALIEKLKTKDIQIEYLCLHVGLGTFKPVYEQNITDQKLHIEPMLIDLQVFEMIAEAKKAEKKFLPVGTTMVRYLESLPYIWRFLQEKKLKLALRKSTQERWNTLSQKISDSLLHSFIPEQEIKLAGNFLTINTRLFLRPGIDFYLTDEMITNFHLPKSSLMMLASAFMGRKNLLQCYQEAIQKKYQFYSFGDGMRIKKTILKCQ